MAQTAGISIERTHTGNPVSITFNLKKWGTVLQNLFFEKGLEIPEEILEPNYATTQAIKNATTNTVATLSSEEDISNYLHNKRIQYPSIKGY
jgi:hypothetical protein